MESWKLLALPIALLSFGCDVWQSDDEQPAGDPQLDALQLGGQPAEAVELEPYEVGQAATADAAVVRATVDEVQLGAGKLVLDAEGGRLKLRARPFELRQLVPGDVGQVSYSAIGEGYWVVPTGQWDVDVSGYGQQTTLTGPIEDLDRESGQMRVRGQELRVHPAQIADFGVGDFVAATFVSIDGQDWVAKVALAKAPPVAGT